MTDRITQTEHDITQVYIQTKSWVRDLKKRVTELEKEVIKLNHEIHIKNKCNKLKVIYIHINIDEKEFVVDLD